MAVRRKRDRPRRRGTRQRTDTYWARAFGGRLERGDDYAELLPVISVLFLDYAELGAGRLHSIFRLLEVHDHARFSDALEIHVVELPELAHLESEEAVREAALVRWSRFFAATTDEEMEEASMADPAIGEAKGALERLSADPAAKALARQRELAMATYRIEMAAALREGKEEGLREGEAKGLREGEAKGLRVAIEDLCEALGIPLDDVRRGEIAASDASALAALRAEIKRTKGWPERHPRTPP